MDIHFNIKFFEPGVRSSVTISGAYEIVKNIEEKPSDFLKKDRELNILIII